jgi:hypothetical protein
LTKLEKNLQYVMNVVNDLFDASEGSVFESINQDELTEVNSFVEKLITKETGIGQQYLVTNIRFVKNENEIVTSGKQKLFDFKIPADTKEIHGWLEDFDYLLSDKTALALYVREQLFNAYDIRYDFQLIKELPMSNDYAIDELHIIDVFDQQYDSYTTATVSLNVPTAYIANLSADDLMFAGIDGIEQAIYENMLRQLHLDIKVYTLSDHILELISDYINEIDPAAPNHISETSYELVCKLTEKTIEADHEFQVGSCDEALAERISSGVFELTSDLVKVPGSYL